MKKILFVHHSGSLGGGTLSLLYTMQGLKKLNFDCVVALAVPSQKLADFYSKAGFKAISWPGISLWHHSTVSPRPLYNPRTWLYLTRTSLSWRYSQQRTLELVEFIKPDVVHLNSMPLSPSADILIKKDIPFVWHVREPPPNQGLRTKLIRKIMMRAKHMIFISEADRQAWVQGENGEVIHNFVDLTQFNSELDSSCIRDQKHIPQDSPVLLYVGGVSVVKGIFPLLYTLNQLKERFPNIKCLMPGAQYQPSGSWKSKLARTMLPKLGSGTLAQKLDRMIQKLGLEDVCVRLPFQENVAPYFACCDVLVFPSIRPHFARPVIEAAAMAKPVVVSDLAGMRELVKNSKTGYLVPSNNSDELCSAITRLLEDSKLREQYGQFAMTEAKSKFNVENQVSRIADIYVNV